MHFQSLKIIFKKCPAKTGLQQLMGRLAQEELVDDIQGHIETMNEDQIGPLPIQKLEVTAILMIILQNCIGMWNKCNGRKETGRSWI